MRSSVKPVRKCHDCPLNLGKECAIYEDPHEEWKKGSCSGYKNEQLIREYQDEQEKHPAKTSKLKRVEHAVQMKSEPHYQGTVNPRTRSVH